MDPTIWDELKAGGAREKGGGDKGVCESVSDCCSDGANKNVSKPNRAVG